MESLSTRELATGIWIVVFLLWGLSRAQIRSALWGLVRASLTPKLAVLWVSGAAWLSVGVYLLSLGSLWDFSDLKDTILWGFSSGGVLLVHGLSQRDHTPDYWKVVRDLFKVTIVVELLLSTYCYSLATELILFILLAFTAAVQVVSGLNEKHHSVHKLANAALAFFSLIMLWRAIEGFVEQPGEIFGLDALKACLRPIFLTLWLLPASYAMAIVAAYELFFIPLRRYEGSTANFKIRARIRLVKHFGFRLSTVLAARKKLMGRLFGVRSMEELDELLARPDHRTTA